MAATGVVLLPLLLAMSGCATRIPASPVTLIKADELATAPRLIDFPAERRGAWIVHTKNDETVICSEPPTDSGLATSQVLGLAADLSKAGIKGGASMDSSLASSLVELKGRTPAVLALRDVMYRMCEARLSGRVLTKEETNVYAEVIRIIGEFAKADLANAEEKQEATKLLAAKQNGLPVETSKNIQLAKEYESDGFAALEAKDWKKAKEAFEKSEAAYSGYGWSYEYARDLKAAGDDAKEVARRILKRHGRLPDSTRDVLNEILSKK